MRASHDCGIAAEVSVDVAASRPHDLTDSTAPCIARRARHGNATTSSIRSAWAALRREWRLGALAVAALALSSIHSDAVPAASGIAVAVLVMAAAVDVHERRLPNLIVGAAAVSFATVLLVELLAGGSAAFASMLGGALVMSAPLLVVHVVSPLAMGLGDVKAAVVLGAAVGAVDWRLALTALAVAAGLTAIAGLVRRVRTIAFGPGLVVGSALTLAVPMFSIAPVERNDDAPFPTSRRGEAPPTGSPTVGQHASGSSVMIVAPEPVAGHTNGSPADARGAVDAPNGGG